jgi:hypothetical protein
MPTYDETSGRAAEMAIKKLKQDAVNVAGGAEIIENQKRRVSEGDAQKAKGIGDDAIEEKSLTGRDTPEKDES